jgi:hypothetical protein
MKPCVAQLIAPRATVEPVCDGEGRRKRSAVDIQNHLFTAIARQVAQKDRAARVIARDTEMFFTRIELFARDLTCAHFHGLPSSRIQHSRRWHSPLLLSASVATVVSLVSL